MHPLSREIRDGIVVVFRPLLFCFFFLTGAAVSPMSTLFFEALTGDGGSKCSINDDLGGGTKPIDFNVSSFERPFFLFFVLDIALTMTFTAQFQRRAIWGRKLDRFLLFHRGTRNFFTSHLKKKGSKIHYRNVFLTLKKGKKGNLPKKITPWGNELF